MTDCQGLDDGVLFDSAAGASLAPVMALDLAALPPMRLPLAWSAIHDALLYADPRAVEGGRVRQGDAYYSIHCIATHIASWLPTV